MRTSPPRPVSTSWLSRRCSYSRRDSWSTRSWGPCLRRRSKKFSSATWHKSPSSFPLLLTIRHESISCQESLFSIEAQRLVVDDGGQESTESRLLNTNRFTSKTLGRRGRPKAGRHCKLPKRTRRRNHYLSGAYA